MPGGADKTGPGEESVEGKTRENVDEAVLGKRRGGGGAHFSTER